MRGALRRKKAVALRRAFERVGLSPDRAEELTELGGLSAVLHAATPDEGAQLEAALELAVAVAMPDDGPLLASTDNVAALFRPRLAGLDHERLYVALVNCRNRMFRLTCVAQGGLTGLSVLPREIFSPAVKYAAAGVILVHNHPSGDPTPSMADRELTARVRQAGEILGIPLLDHVVVASGGCASV